MFRWSRYLATVLRATLIPFSLRSFSRAESESGFLGFSEEMSSWMVSRTEEFAIWVPSLVS